MDMRRKLVESSVNHPKLVTALMAAITLVFALGAGLPTLFPEAVPFLHPLQVDTDPENMLPEDEAVRVFHDAMKKEMALHDMIVLGVVNEKDPDGVFNPRSLRRIYELTEYAKGLRWPDPQDPEKQIGVISVDLIAPSTVDNIEPGGLGVVKFEWLMPEPPKTREEALEVRRKAERIPFLEGTLVSEDGKAICLYIPITAKNLSYKISTRLREKIAGFTGDERYFITGLPVAEDTFGVEMFQQMAVSAPLAMVIIFFLMLFFFRKLLLIASPLIVALVSVISTMGLLVGLGYTVHIMSSMIPIFIMPIAVLDAIHILSEFFDRYPEKKDRKVVILGVMETLFTPMLYTSLTTAVGFASLALTPIPPVQVFGLFVALGVMVAWVWTVTFIPAFVMFIPEGRLENFGHGAGTADAGEHENLLTRFLGWTGRVTFRRARLVAALTVLAAAAAVAGITRIRVNDNPTKWFEKSHPIRVADKVLNAHFGGTYMAYLSFEYTGGHEDPAEYVKGMTARMKAKAGALADDGVEDAEPVFAAFAEEARRRAEKASTKEELLRSLETFASAKSDAGGADALTWDEALLFIDEERDRDQVFKHPALLAYIDRVKAALLRTGVVGKANTLTDIVKTVHRELLEGDPAQFKIPDSSKAVVQCLYQYQSSHRPQDLWHFVTPDYRKSVIWVQLKSGDNVDMTRVADAVEAFVAANPPPVPVELRWFGLTYINVVWQEKMVSGMLEAFLGSFLIVFLMMTLVYRSALWGILSMIPLTVTIGLIYGAIGFAGKDYDMPVAVLSSLSLGLAVDYAIHFLSRSRELRDRFGDWSRAVGHVFGEPARAIARNAVVVGVGFLPLLLAPLVPYQTVGTFIAAILFTAGVASILILPALVTLLERALFPQTRTVGLLCRCGTLLASGASLAAAVVINIHQFFDVGWTALTPWAVGVILVLVVTCIFTRRSRLCYTGEETMKGDER